MLQVFVGFEDLVAVLRVTAATAVPTVKREALARLGFEDAALFHLCFENRVLDEKLRLCDVPVPRNATLRTHAKISHEAQGLEVTHIDHDAVHHPGHITHHHEHHDHDDPHHGLGARRATHHHAHKEPSAAEPSAQMTRRHTMGLLREGTMKQQLPSSKGGRYG